jgi:septal ring-binding cell division protein DamX
MEQPAVPIVNGGSRLVLSDTLSRPPQAADRPVAAAQSPPAPDEVAPASEQATPILVASVASTPPLATPQSGTGQAGEVVASALADSAPDPASAVMNDGVGPLTEARLAATRDWLASADDRHFSIQLLLTDFARRANLETFLRARQDAGEVDDYYVFETRIRSNTWYGVLYKEYASFGAAKAALEELPEEFQYHQPFIRNVRDIATLG